MSKRGVVAVYTDGGCSGNPGPGGWAFVVTRAYAGKASGVSEGLVEGDVSGSGAEAYTTNNRMELTAVIKALSFVIEKGVAANGEKIEVYTDSQYVQKGITEWVSSWKRKNWKNAERQPVKNQDLWMALDKLNAALSPSWFWVKGHAGNTYNEICDRLTQEAIASL